ncbi:MAG: hypothetical protein U1B80_02335, partial [Anaerolineaceae bacterium]|nr:hypothetical protein [Anaerolineaceae bacterium]
LIARIALFDLDEVLIRPGGYRRAFRETMRYFYRKMDAEALAPGETLPEYLEQDGINSEWDMVPLCLAIYLESCLGLVTEYPSLPDLPTALDWARQWRGQGLQVDYIAQAALLAPIIRRDKEELGIPVWRSLHQHTRTLLPKLAEHSLYDELLGYNRQIERSWTMRVFQNFLLGEHQYQQTYSLLPEVNAVSCLEQYDQPLLEQKLRDEILAMAQRKELFVAAFTARPSLPPRGVEDTLNGYSPEAETALRILGLECLPITALGRLNYLGAQRGVSTESLLKPALVHALAAIAAAWTGEELPALQLAYEFAHPNGGNPVSPATGTDNWLKRCGLPDEAEIHIFEDSPSGLLAGERATSLINRSGGDYRLFKWGIAGKPEKAAYLKALGATVFADCNTAIRHAFGIPPVAGAD